MVTREKVINDFYEGKKKGKASSLSIDDTNKGTALYSYATPIAYRNKEGKVYMTSKRFSQSTSTQQNKLRTKGDVKVLPNDEYKQKLDKEGVPYSYSRL